MNINTRVRKHNYEKAKKILAVKGLWGELANRAIEDYKKPKRALEAPKKAVTDISKFSGGFKNE